MNNISKKILDDYQVRKTKKQKEIFRNYIIKELEEAGYIPKIHNKKKTNNIIIGDIKNAKAIFTAHYDTCAVLPFPNLIVPDSLLGFILTQLFIMFMILLFAVPISLVVYLLFLLFGIKMFTYFIGIILVVLWMYYGKANKHTANDNTSGVITIIEAALKIPKEYRKDICFILFDNEEVGLVGSSILAKEYKEIVKDKLVINFDCVSDGDDIFFFPSKQLKKDKDNQKIILDAFNSFKEKEVKVNKGFGIYPSDNLRFKKSYGVCALKKGIFNYMRKIHTSRDIIFDERNINLLSDGICKLVMKLVE